MASEEEKPRMVDQELLEAFKTNPQAGFQLIVKKYQERIYWQIRRLTKNHQDTEDVMQNVFIKVWNGLENFRADSNLYTWMYRIAFNETHTFLTKNQKRTTVDIDPPLFENKVVTEGGKELSGDEIEAILNKALDQLPEKQRQVFELKYFDELKFTEISEMLGTSVGALKTSYHLASKKIEEYIKRI
ncbi:sigma-70 family RNA polymerase sigma factor [Paracrocinitomix mangrovi]|uniref:RNA polymerase sigma factor n=1 Tax=Paracrocinitomix mangrovi TaxID=2862509 RepID=UPI001EDBF5B6|nr:sigma-70 family RNA polymerase sigma factor [Paracrocinitomix mangrovi]UKN02508.1 sigma-70 family RNA polymerase sigma factor [Paracrocinitomix mangrovi]